jgi:hypothetical protein
MPYRAVYNSISSLSLITCSRGNPANLNLGLVLLNGLYDPRDSLTNKLTVYNDLLVIDADHGNLPQ